jgi:hypothetical protein
MNKCSECAKLQTTCCADGRSEICVTRGDIRRIEEAKKLIAVFNAEIMDVNNG